MKQTHMCLLLSYLGVMGCTRVPFDFTGRGCKDDECLDGFVCHPITDQCVPGCRGVAAGTHLGTRTDADGSVELVDSQIWPLDGGWIDTTDLAAYWRLDGVLGALNDGESIVDASGNLRHGTAHTGTTMGSMTYQQAKIAQGIALDGVDDFIDYEGIALSGDFTLQAWINTASSADQVFIGNNRLGGGLGYLNGTVTLSHDECCRVSWDSIRDDGQWHLMTVTRIGNTAELYVDALSQGQRDVNGYVWDGTDTRFQFLGRASAGSGFFQGTLDEVSIWSRALGVNEITRIYQRQAPRITGIYTSSICDAGNSMAWASLVAVPEAPYGKEMSPEMDTGYAVPGIDGVVGLWHLNGEGLIPANSQILDSSDQENHGTATGLMGMSHRRGIFGGSVDFIDDRIMLGDPADGSLDFGTAPFSYTLWVYVNESVGSFDMPWFKGGGSANSTGYDIELGSGSWVAILSDGGSSLVFVAFGQEADFLGRWAHLAVVVDRDNDLLLGLCQWNTARPG